MDRKNGGAEISRRDFLKNMGRLTGGVTLLAATPWLTFCTPEKHREIAGERAVWRSSARDRAASTISTTCGRSPMPKWSPLCDDYEPNLRAAQRLCPGAKCYTDYRRLLEDPSIDGVIVSTPLDWHGRMTLDALAAGKHVFCEKAMARTLDECRAIYDAYGRTDGCSISACSACTMRNTSGAWS